MGDATQLYHKLINEEMAAAKKRSWMCYRVSIASGAVAVIAGLLTWLLLR